MSNDRNLFVLLKKQRELAEKAKQKSTSSNVDVPETHTAQSQLPQFANLTHPIKNQMQTTRMEKQAENKDILGKRAHASTVDDGINVKASNKLLKTDDAVIPATTLSNDSTVPLQLPSDTVLFDGRSIDEKYLSEVESAFKRALSMNLHEVIRSPAQHRNQPAVILSTDCCYMTHFVLYTTKEKSIRIAQDVKSGEWVNIKKQKVINDEQKFETEKVILKKLGWYRTDCKLTDSAVNETPGTSYLVYKHTPGLSLEAMLKTPQDFNVKHTIALNAVQALIDLHNKGVVHCDIKLDNLIVNPKNLEVALIDFDVSLIMDANGQGLAKECRGTPGFISPETFEPIEMDGDLYYVYERSTDMYSLGVTLVKLFDLDPFFKMDNGRLCLKNNEQGLFASRPSTEGSEIMSIIQIIQQMLAPKSKVTLEQVKENLTKLIPTSTNTKTGITLNTI